MLEFSVNTFRNDISFFFRSLREDDAMNIDKFGELFVGLISKCDSFFACAVSVKRRCDKRK